MLGAADRFHAIALRGFDELSVVVLHQAPGGKGPAGDPPQQEPAHIAWVAQSRQQSQPATRRATADEGRSGVEFLQQLVEITGPHLVFGIPAVERNVGGTAIAAVVDQHAITRLGDLLSEGLHPDQTAAPAGLQRDPGTAVPEQLVIDCDAADIRDRHGFSSIVELA
jgi:hypothetical protein